MKRANLEKREIVTNLRVPKSWFIWNMENDVPLCWDNKALTFSTKEHAENLASSCFTPDEYKLKYVEMVWEYGMINADGLIVYREEKQLEDGTWSCEDILIENSI